MPVILALYAAVLALAIWQEDHGRDSEEKSEQEACRCS